MTALIDRALLGTWVCPPRASYGEETIFRIFPDGRTIDFIRQHPSLKRHVGRTFRAFPEGTDRFRIKTDASAEGFLITMRRDGDNLVTVDSAGHTLVHCRLEPAEIPEWVETISAMAVWR